jgi:molecular chaperone GrpE
VTTENEKPEIDDTDTAAEAPEAQPQAGDAEALRAENAELMDKLLRALAEVENVRRRAEQDQAKASKFAISAFARDLLTVGDNLRRALESLPEAIRQDDSLAGVLTGIEMTEKELLTAFEKHGIRLVYPLGEKFDHNLHQAMFEVETADEAPGTVVQVVQTGYVLNDRLLRPAMVGVARKAPGGGGPGGTIDTSA